MVETTHQLVPAPADNLRAELRALIASSRQRLAGAVNAELTHEFGRGFEAKNLRRTADEKTDVVANCRPSGPLGF